MTGDFAIASVGVWDVTPTAGVEWAGVLGGADAPQAAAFTADGAAVIVPGDGGTVEVWDASGSGLVRTIGSRPGGDEAVRRVAVSPSGRWLATATDVSVDIWDVGTGEHVTSLTGDGDEVGVNELVWSPNDELAIPVYTQSGGRVVIVDRAGAEIDRLSLDPGTTAGSLSFDPSGDILLVSVLSARNDPAQQVARLWDWRAGAVLRTLPARTFEAVFDPTGNRVATSGRLQSTLEVWDAATGDPVWSTTTRSLTNNVQFSADGGRIATAGLDGTVRIWDAETGVQQLVLEAHESPVSTVAFSPDGSRLVSASFDGVVRVWALELDDLEAIARDRLTRTLTDDECREYLHVESCA